MTTWADFRTQIRRTVLKDENATRYRWPDTVLLDAMNWSMDTLCAHTAIATGVEYAASGVGPYSLPDNTYESVEQSGQVYTRQSATIVYNYDYLNPVRYTDGMNFTSDKGYYEWPEGQLCLLRDPGDTAIVGVRYFAYYNHLVADEDAIPVPRWSLIALAYLTAAYALTGDAVKSANIRQWAESPEKGTPEDNSLRKQQEYFFEQYEREISRYPRQDRENQIRDFI